jgi:glycerol-3-phosphate acyltransferase PlsX
VSRVRIAIDIASGDYGASVTLPAALRFAKAHPHSTLLLVGNQEEITPFVTASIAKQCQVVHAPQVVDMDEAPTKALRRKRESSMSKAIECVQMQRADICVSSGNTGALMAMSHTMLKTREGISRPAIMGLFPGYQGAEVAMLDLGADVTATAESLCQQAYLAAAIIGKKHGKAPRVALLNVGHESIKGTATVKTAHQMLSEQNQIHYVGFVEGNQIFFGAADIVVCDGFVGNIVLKSCEGMAKLLYQGMRDQLRQQPWFAMLNRTPLKHLLTQVFEPYSTDHRNGALLIGLNGLVVKSHGNAKEKAFYQALALAYNTIQGCDKAAYAAPSPLLATELG